MEFDVETFRKNVYSVLEAVPFGRVLTYGQVAWLVGMPNHSRWVGRVLRGVPEELHLPCHRIVNSSGRTAPHWAAQKTLLEAEGVTFRKNGCVDMKKHQWHVDSEEIPEN